MRPVCQDVETAQGVPITVTGVAQVCPSLTRICAINLRGISSASLIIQMKKIQAHVLPL